MYMPGGVNEIVCGMGQDAAAQVVVQVGPETAAALQASFQKLSAKLAPQRLLFDKEHESKEAMAWPARFEWSDTPRPGVYALVEWSRLGLEYVKGKVMRAFSPSFFTDADLPKRREVRSGQTYSVRAGGRGSAQNPARITGLDWPYAGTLTNNPAFREILPLWAKDAGATRRPLAAGLGASSTPNQTDMNKEKVPLQTLKDNLEREIAELSAQDQTMENADALKAKQSELADLERQMEAAALKAKNEQLEAALLAEREKDASRAVQAAIRRGALPAKDEALQAKWKKWCVEDPEMIEALNATKGSTAMQPRLTVMPVSIQREDSQAVLKAFGAERDPHKRAAIYATQIRPRLKEGDDLPLRAATITAGTLVGTLVTQRSLELLRFALPPLSRMITNFDSEPGMLNQAIYTRYQTVPNVVAYESGGAGTGWAAQDWTNTDAYVTLNQHKGCEIVLKETYLAGTVRRLFDEMGAGQAYAIAKDIVDYAYALITAGNFTNAAIQAAQIDFGRSTVIDMAVAQTLKGVPQGASNRTLVLYPTYYGQLAKDQAIITLAAQQQPGIITGGVLPDVHGYYVIEAGNLPSTGNLKGFAFSKSALLIAARPDGDYVNAIPGAADGNSVVVTDPDTGFSVRQTQYVDHQLAAAAQRLSFYYGASVGQAAAGQILTT